MTTDEKIFANAVRQAYIEVYGVEKWNSLTDAQVKEVLHICLNDFAKLIGVK